MTYRTIIPALALVLTACSSAPSIEEATDMTEKAADTANTASETADSAASLAETSEAVLAKAQERAAALKGACQAYFESEQLVSTADGAEPWHLAGEDTDPAGYPLRWAEYTFPGGTNFTLTSHPSIPSKGAAVAAQYNASNPAFLEASLAKLGLVDGEELPFRLTFTTGAGTSQQASCTITIEADIDPSNDSNLSLTQVLTVDDMTQEVSAAEPVITPEIPSN